MENNRIQDMINVSKRISNVCKYLSLLIVLPILFIVQDGNMTCLYTAIAIYFIQLIGNILLNKNAQKFFDIEKYTYEEYRTLVKFVRDAKFENEIYKKYDDKCVFLTMIDGANVLFQIIAGAVGTFILVLTMQINDPKIPSNIGYYALHLVLLIVVLNLLQIETFRHVNSNRKNSKKEDSKENKEI